MSLYEVALVVHVLAWVFWLGTDVGAFMGAKYAERSDISVEARLTVFELCTLLERAPRFAVPVVWFTGIVMMDYLGYGYIPLFIGIAFTLLWLAVTWVIVFRPPGSAFHDRGKVAETVIFSCIIIGMGIASSWLLATGQMPLWLAIKWFAFVLVAIAVLILERKFAPVAKLFEQLAAEGASDTLNVKIQTAITPAYPIVLAIYACTIVAAISGLTKPML